jgi:carbon starvation protein
MIATGPDLAGKGPGVIYGDGLGRYLAVIIGEERRVFAATFGAMAFSTFVFDTLDVTTRLGRYIVQELTGWTGRTGAMAGTAITVLVPLALLAAAGAGAYQLFWVLFGTSNQLLAALTLLGISVWLHRSGRRSLYTWLPMGFVMAVTLWSLLLQLAAAVQRTLRDGFQLDAPTINGVASALLTALALALVLEAIRAVRAPAAEATAA